MLTGIKTGKRKKQRGDQKPPPTPPSAPVALPSSSNSNAAAAALWKESLATTGKPPVAATISTLPYKEAVLQKQKKPANPDEMTVEDMVREEKMSSTGAVDDQTRNAMRLGKRRRRFKEAADSDEEEERAMTLVQGGAKLRTDTQRERASAKEGRRQHHQSLSRQSVQTAQTAKSWWWMESPQFQKHRLLALGNHVSLVWAPSSHALVDGHSFFIVPASACTAWNSCDEDAWQELRRFQNALQAMYAEVGKSVLFWETVLETNQFWQARMQAVAVDAKQAQDTPLYFKQALAQVAEEWGTHQKILKVTAIKDLRRTVPKNFSYFFIDFGGPQASAGESVTGFCQLIESKEFSKDFGADTIAGMLDMEPLRYRNRTRVSDKDEREGILRFLERWKPFDWTLALDGE